MSRACAIIPTTSSLALRATAFSGFGLDFAVPIALRLPMTSTDWAADFISVHLRKKRTCMMNRD
jgi:hypothetical protein